MVQRATGETLKPLLVVEPFRKLKEHSLQLVTPMVLNFLSTRVAISRYKLSSLPQYPFRQPYRKRPRNISSFKVLNTYGNLMNSHIIPTFYVSVWFEPTDIHKAAKPFKSENWRTMDFLSPNFNELRIMCYAAGMQRFPLSSALNHSDEEVVEKARELALFLANTLRTVIATLGHRGVIVCRRDDADTPFFSVGTTGVPKRLPDQTQGPPKARYYSAPPCQPVSVSGAGDCWNAGFISAALQGKPENICVEAGFRAALCSLAVASAVPTDINIEAPLRTSSIRA